MTRKLLLAAMLMACGGDLDPASRIVSFRTLAMRATRVVQSDTCDAGLVPAADARPGVAPKLGNTRCEASGAYARPGDEVQLELLWHDPNATAKRSWMWTTCVNPASTTVFGCFQKLAQDAAKLPPEQRLQLAHQRVETSAKTFEGNELAADPARDPRTIFRVSIPADALKQFEGKSAGAKKAASVGVVFLACPGNLQLKLEATASLRNALPVACLDAKTGEELGSDKFTIGIKRIFLREKDENNDPRINNVLFDGKPWPEAETRDVQASCDPNEARFDRCDDPKHDIALDLAQPFAEIGSDEFGEAYREQVVVQFYVTEGLFESDIKRAEDPRTRFAGRREKLGDQRMWIVIRDSRGGVSWLERMFRVVPR